jgi:basic amino acid/polyamine antiporter, APA family
MDKSKTKLNLFNFTMIVVSLVIGMGIFRTATDSAKEAHSPAIYFGAWIIGGFIALCGALTYAEIGSRLPVTGGYYKIFSYAYHPSIAFAINCIILISNAASLAIVALIGAGYLQESLLPDAQSWVKTAIAMAAIIAFYGVNLLGLQLSAKAQTFLMLFKIAMLLFIISAMFFPSAHATNTASFWGNNNSSWDKMLLSFGAAMVAVSFTYGGYQQTINFGNEVVNPHKNISKGIFYGIFIIIVLYLLVNLSYYTVVGFDWMQQRPEGKQIGTELAKKIIGNTGATIFSALLFFCVLSYVNALLLSNPRVMSAMSTDGVLPKAFAKRTPKTDTLFISLTTFAALCIVILFFSDAVDKLLSFTIFLDCFGMVLSAATIFKLRKKTSHLNDTGIYTIKWFPLIPVFFIVAYTFVAISIFITKTNLSLIALAVLAFFMVLYFVIEALKPKHNK